MRYKQKEGKSNNRWISIFDMNRKALKCAYEEKMPDKDFSREFMQLNLFKFSVEMILSPLKIIQISPSLLFWIFLHFYIAVELKPNHIFLKTSTIFVQKLPAIIEHLIWTDLLWNIQINFLIKSVLFHHFN